MKGYEKIKEFVDGELDNYSFFHIEKVEMYDTNGVEEYYRVEVKTNSDKTKILHFKYDTENGKIFIELGEDSYEYVEDYSYTIKYFWMALLEW